MGQTGRTLGRYPAKLIRTGCSETAIVPRSISGFCPAERMGAQEQGSKVRAFRLVESLALRSRERHLSYAAYTWHHYLPPAFVASDLPDVRLWSVSGLPTTRERTGDVSQAMAGCS